MCLASVYAPTVGAVRTLGTERTENFAVTRILAKSHVCTAHQEATGWLWVMLRLNPSILTPCRQIHHWDSFLAPLRFYWDRLLTRVGFSPLIQHLEAKVHAAYWGRPCLTKKQKDFRAFFSDLGSSCFSILSAGNTGIGYHIIPF